MAIQLRPVPKITSPGARWGTGQGVVSLEAKVTSLISMLHDGKGEHLRWHRSNDIVPVAHLGVSGHNAHVRAINALGQVELRFVHPNHTRECIAERKSPARECTAASECVWLGLTTYKMDVLSLMLS